MIIYTFDKLSIRTLESKDVNMLVKWLSDPEVLQYYEGRDNPHDEAMVKEGFFDEAENEVLCIVEYDNVPIGYIQFYPIVGEERDEYGYADCSDIIYGTDQFIGETSYWNQGIGSMLVNSMVSYLINEKEADKVVMDPQCWNHRAIRCYEKCGFRKKKLLPEHEMHEGEIRDCWLMEYSK